MSAELIRRAVDEIRKWDADYSGHVASLLEELVREYERNVANLELASTDKPLDDVLLATIAAAHVPGWYEACQVARAYSGAVA